MSDDDMEKMYLISTFAGLFCCALAFVIYG